MSTKNTLYAPKPLPMLFVCESPVDDGPALQLNLEGGGLIQTRWPGQDEDGDEDVYILIHNVPKGILTVYGQDFQTGGLDYEEIIVKAKFLRKADDTLPALMFVS